MEQEKIYNKINIKTLIKKYLPYKISGFGYFMVFLQFYYLFQVFVTDDTGGFSFTYSTYAKIILSMFTILIFFQILATIFSKSRKTIITAQFTGLGLYGILVSYHFGARELLNWSVITDNVSSAFTLESFNVILNSLDTDALLYILVFFIIFSVLEFFKKTVSKMKQNNPFLPKIIVSSLIYLTFIFLPFESFDPYVNFFRSISHHYFNPIKMNKVIKKNEYPMLFTNKKQTPVNQSLKNKPHIFLIIAESLNASAINKTNPQGKAYTPFLNSLKNKSIFIENFYGNSIQTAKGHFAILFSTIPSISGKTFTKYKDLKIQSIASILKQYGYQTTYFTAYNNYDFDNEGNFLTKRGFQEFVTAKIFLTEKEKKENYSRWGPEDSTFFKRFFDYFESQKKTKPNQPKFFVLTTIFNHFPFNTAPETKQFLYKNPKNIREDYANSIHLTDLGIKTFFQELKKRKLLKNSLIIITSDHAFPMGEHGNYHLEAGYHQESFQIPLFIVWQKKLQPAQIKTAHSQMDIAPTILDLISINPKKHNFQGQSVFKSSKQKPAYLIQPYGKHLSIISYPYKYRYFDKTNQEFIYNLQTDPMETTNIISKTDKNTIANFRKNLEKIYLNQYCIENNQFWPNTPN